MTLSHRLALLVPLALAASLPLPACHTHIGPHGGSEVVVHERGGPPPHAPAHGYRRKHQAAHHDVELVFDSGLGVYVVVGFPGVYFHADSYFRYVDAGWQVSVRPDSGWRVASVDHVPPGLRKQKHGKSKHGGHPGPAKKRN